MLIKIAFYRESYQHILKCTFFKKDREHAILLISHKKSSIQATKVTKKVRSRMNGTDHDPCSFSACNCTDLEVASHDAKDEHSASCKVNNTSAVNTNRNNNHSSSTEEVDGKMGFHKIISSKAEALFAKKGLNWPWKMNENVVGTGQDAKSKFVWPWLQNEQENNQVQVAGPVSRSDPSSTRGGDNIMKAQNPTTQTHTGSWSSFNANSTSSISSSGSTSGSAVNKVDLETDCLDCEILWEDLIIGEHIGQGTFILFYFILFLRKLRLPIFSFVNKRLNYKRLKENFMLVYYCSIYQILNISIDRLGCQLSIKLQLKPNSPSTVLLTLNF